MNESIRYWIEGRPAPVVEAAISYLGVKKLKLNFSVLLHMRHHMPRQFRKVQKQILEAGIEAAEANPYSLNQLLDQYEWLVGPGAENRQSTSAGDKKPERGFKLRLAYSSDAPGTENGEHK